MKQYFDQFLKLLNQPYPEAPGVRSFCISSFWIGVFVGGFLFVFRPFGMDQAGERLAWHSFIFGLITFLVSFGFDLLVRYVLKINRDTGDWVFWKWLVSMVTLILLIAMGNYLYMWWEFGLSLSFKGFVVSLLYTFLIGLFPILFFGMLNSQKSLKKNKSLAEQINSKLNFPKGTTVSLAAEVTKESFEISPRNILFIEALQNYVVVHYENGEKEEQKIIRNTLTAIESKLQGSNIERSHRSYLVNRDKITGVEGNAQGLKLSLTGIEHKQVPVSRRFIHRFQNT